VQRRGEERKRGSRWVLCTVREGEPGTCVNGRKQRSGRRHVAVFPRHPLSNRTRKRGGGEQWFSVSRSFVGPGQAAVCTGLVVTLHSCLHHWTTIPSIRNPIPIPEFPRSSSVSWFFFPACTFVPIVRRRTLSMAH
jgi:hypothetical protein